LAHDDISNWGLGLTEVDHETNTENLQRDEAQGNVLEFASGADDSRGI
jgi:hypothetical protein